MSIGVYIPAAQPYEETLAKFVPNLEDYYRYPERYAMEPFQIFGNLYYVGDKKVCCHLVDTGDGLILFDTGYAHTMHILLSNIRALGFAPADIKYIIHSHGHFDHFGCTRRLKALYGCTVCMGKADADHLCTHPQAALNALGPEPFAAIPDTDLPLRDGDEIRLGNTCIRCVEAAGHTEGVMAFFFDAIDEPIRKRVGYWGGIGLFTIHKAHLTKYALPLDLPQRMLETICRLRRESVDITIGNHPSNNGTEAKRAYMCAHPQENPFLDCTVWEEVLDRVQDNLEDFVQKQY